MSTHAHYAGEFGARKMTKKLEKDPAYRAARAEHYAGVAREAAEAHRLSSSASDRAGHALVAAHAESRARSHARASAKMAPGSEHEKNAASAAAEASKTHQIMKAREKVDAPGATVRMAPVSSAELAHALSEQTSKMSVTPPLKAAYTRESVATTTPLPVFRHEDVPSGRDLKGKNAEYHAVHAEKHLESAVKAHTDYQSATGHADRAKALLTLNHAKNKLDKHAAMASQLAPGSSHAASAASALSTVREHLSSVGLTKSSTPVTKSSTPVTKSSTPVTKSSSVIRPSTPVTPHLITSHVKHDDQHLADVIHRATESAVGEHQRFGDRKVFTHEVYNSMHESDRAKFGTVDQFKDKLRELHRSNHVTLSRADYVQAMNSKQVESSHVNLEGGKHTFGDSHAGANFIEDRSVALNHAKRKMLEDKSVRREQVELPIPHEDVHLHEFRAQLWHALDSHPGDRHNHVPIYDVRKSMPSTHSRQDFDKKINELIKLKHITMDVHDGRHGQLTEEQLAGGISQASIGDRPKLIYISRRKHRLNED